MKSSLFVRGVLKGALGLGFVAALGLILTPGAFGLTLEEAARPYRGKTIVLGVAFVPVMNGLLELVEKEFVARTGINVKIEKYSLGQWNEKGDADLFSGTGHFDVLQMHHNRAQDWAVNGHVRWINDFMEDRELRDPDLDPEDFLQPLWDDYCLFEDGKRACFPTFNFQEIYWYRNDLFTHPDEQAVFKGRYGYDLQPAKTFQQMRDVAEFFTRKKGEELAGRVLEEDFYGIGLSGEQEQSTAWGWYTVLQGWGGSLFDKEGHPTFDHPRNIEAMEWWFDMQRFAPPQVTETGRMGLFIWMTKGNVAQAIHQIDFSFAIDDPRISKTVGLYGYSLLPVREEGMEPGGWGEAGPLIISRHSKNPEAAYLLIQWMSSKEVQEKWIEGPGSGLPIRKSTLNLPFVLRHSAFVPAIHSARRGWFQPGFSDWATVERVFIVTLREAAIRETQVGEALGRVQQRALEIHPEGSINPGQPTRNQLWTHK
jgi:ABC-type glycerol-3-phosphate transport system substrate-binding protein